MKNILRLIKLSDILEFNVGVKVDDISFKHIDEFGIWTCSLWVAIEEKSRLLRLCTLLRGFIWERCICLPRFLVIPVTFCRHFFCWFERVRARLRLRRLSGFNYFFLRLWGLRVFRYGFPDIRIFGRSRGSVTNWLVVSQSSEEDIVRGLLRLVIIAVVSFYIVVIVGRLRAGLIISLFWW